MDRRSVLAMMGATALPSSLLMAGSAHAALNLDVNNPDHVLLIHRKLAHSLGRDPIFWWIKTSRFGLMDSAFTPLWGQNGGAIFATRNLDDQGTYEASVVIISFTTDLQTGELIDRFVNPYTGEDMKLRSFGGTRPIRVVYRSRGGEAIDERGSPPGFRIVANGLPVGPALIQGDDVWVRSDNVIRMEPLEEGKGRLMQVNDWNTYHGSLADVSNPDLLSAPATWDFNDINTWPSWMAMGDLPGNYVARGVGRKVFSLEDMPDDWLELMEERHPDILDDPAAAASFDD